MDNLCEDKLSVKLKRELQSLDKEVSPLLLIDN